MHRYVVPLVALTCVFGFGFASGAHAFTNANLRCQSAIGEAGREFAAARLKAIVACKNDLAGGDTCDVTRRDRMIAGASQALVRRIVGACSDAALAELGFPGTCFDASGGSFVIDDLTLCIHDRHATATDNAAGIQYPQVQTFLRDERRCQRGLGRAGSAFIAETMRARSRCLDAQLGERIPETVDCRAEVQPYGPGTGDARTDHVLMQTTARLFSRLAEACFRADVAALGYPGPCPGPLGDLGVDDVQRCVRATHQVVSNDMLAAEYPPPATATPPVPSPSPSPTPLPVSLEILPKSAKKSVGMVQNFTVRGDYANGDARNLTQRVEYSSSDESVAVAPNEPGNRSRILLVGRGTALITATEPITGITSDAATLTVVSCPHAVCVVGAAIDSDCSPCATAICAADPSCCADSWSQACVDAVPSICAVSCTTAAD